MILLEFIEEIYVLIIDGSSQKEDNTIYVGSPSGDSLTCPLRAVIKERRFDMVNLMKKNMILGIILDLLLCGGGVLLVEFILSLIGKRPFSPDWRWVIWISAILTIGDVLSARKKKDK